MTWPFDDEIPHEWSEDDLEPRVGTISEIEDGGGRFRCAPVHPAPGDLIRIGDPEKGMRDGFLVLLRSDDGWIAPWPPLDIWPVEVGNEVWLIASIGRIYIA